MVLLAAGTCFAALAAEFTGAPRRSRGPRAAGKARRECNHRRVNSADREPTRPVRPRPERGGIARGPCRSQRRDHRRSQVAAAGQRPAADDQRSGRASWSNGRSCAATRTKASELPLLSFNATRTPPGRQSDCCAAAPRARCGPIVPTRPTCGRSSARKGRSAPRENSPSPARCSCRATAPARRAWCATRGATTISRASSRAWRSTSSTT